MIFVTGDIHRKPQRFSTDGFVEQRMMNKYDYVIVLGDFGLILDKDKESNFEKYWLDWLDRKPFTTLFLDGNHENFDRLDDYPVEEWNGGKIHRIRPSVIHLMRGQVFTLQNHTFFTFGGASSHDISDGILELDDPFYALKKKRLNKNPYSCYRVNHLDWWQRELPSEEEMKEGLQNLKSHQNQVDFILTHSPSSALLEKMANGNKEYQPDILTDYLQNILETVNYKSFLFGHMHENECFSEENAFCLYEQIVRIL